MEVEGSNLHEQELRRRADRRKTVLDDIADLQEDLKEFKKEDKADGYSEKALAQVIKEMRRGEDFQVGQLQLELELDTYRKAVGLPTTLDDAQKRAAEASASVPAAESDDTRSKRKGMN